MISENERREVAQRLRKAIGLTEFAEVLGFDWTDDSDWVWNDVSNLVADLIEPSEPEVKYVAEVKFDGWRLEELVHDAAVELTGIDRDALLELVKELELGAQCVVGREWPNAECESMGKHLADDYEMIACRIREALGVADE